MVTEIQAKTLLPRVKRPDTWFGLDYSMNLYRGCQHQCIYCDSRSECYGIDDFSDILVKTNAIELLRSELARKRSKGTIGTGSMNDSYMPVEAEILLTRRALEVIAEHRFRLHVLTKSDLVLRDVDLLQRIGTSFAAVSFTITTTDDGLARVLEPGAPLPSARLRAMETLADSGVLTGVIMMPILPFIEDNEENILSIIDQSAEHGAGYIVPALGMTLRDRQREWYYARLDEHFPGLRRKYQARYANRYHCPVPNAATLEASFNRRCREQGIATRFPAYIDKVPEQGSLF